MRFDTSNPAFLQAAGNRSFFMRMTTSVVNQEFYELSANGLVYIDSVKNGAKVRKTLINPNNEFVTIENDADTEIIVWGEVTRLIAGGDANTGLTSLDLSKNPALTELDCYDCPSLTSLDLSKNPALTELSCASCVGLTSLDLSKNLALTKLDCSKCTCLTSLDLSKNLALTRLSCGSNPSLTSLDLSNNTALTYLGSRSNTGLTSINGIAVNSEVSTSIASAITDATSVDGTVTLRQGDEFNQTIIDAAMDKGWGVQYYQ